jgi:PAS domain S-box-containing protein
VSTEPGMATKVAGNRSVRGDRDTAAADELFAGPGEMRALCRQFDWAATSLGPVETWSFSLRVTARTVLACRNPMFLWWGPDLVQIYNDAYRPSFGEEGRHPSALGMRGADCWTDTWPTISPQIEQVMSGGESVWHEDQYIPIERNGRLDDVWWTYSYSPVFDDDGSIGGTLVVCLETTSRIIAERERRDLLESTARAERALRESEAQLRAIYDGTNEYIGLLAPDGTLLEANRASLAFAHSARADVVGQPFWDTPLFAYTPGMREIIQGAVARAAGGEFVRFEAAIESPSGVTMTFDISLHPVRDRSGDVIYIVPEGREITERKRAEEALRASESRYRELFESLDDGFCVVEMIFDAQERPIDYRFIEANSAFAHQTGLANAVGRTAREMVPDLEAHWFEKYGRTALTGEPQRFELASDAMNRWFSVYAFRSGRPEERRVALLFSDVTEAKAAERDREELVRALELERSRLADVFRQAPAFLAVLRGPEHVLELVNNAYYQLVGNRDLLGKPMFEAIPEGEGQGFRELLDEVLNSGVPFVGREVPLRIARTRGAPAEERFIDLTYLPMLNAGGERTGIIAHGTDVTEQVVARREVERLLSESERERAEAESARRAAEEADLAKSQFLATMSHELRTPLNAIQGHVQLLDMGLHGPVTASQRTAFERIDRSQRHLLSLVNDVLNYARLGSGRVEYRLESVLVGEILNDVLPMIEPQQKEKGITVEVRTPESGPGCIPVPVLADAEKLVQILLNLLSNAVKFTHPGGRITIELTASDDADVAYCRVSDTGIGIPPDKLEAVFEPFVQVRTDYARMSGGTGLGLAISRDLARAMGGDLRVKSAPGEGSTFTLVLPRA